MKSFYFVLFFIVFSLNAFSQIYTNSNSIQFSNLNDGRNVPDGISWYTSSPLNYGIYRTSGSWASPNYQQLKFSWATGIIIDGGSAYGKSGINLQPNGGSVSIGAYSTTGKLSIQSTGQIPLYIKHISTSNYTWGVTIDVDNNTTAAFRIRNSLLSGTPDMFMIRGNGVVNAKSIYAEAFQVRADAMSQMWPDYVFDKNYKLKKINDLELFINENGHLPEVPSKQEISNGYNLSDMDILLLKKVEELTLYVIDLKKENDVIKKELSELKK